eukprot:scaffold1_cov402-Prasinococcus_capsulatus_cf.AAC.70
MGEPQSARPPDVRRAVSALPHAPCHNEKQACGSQSRPPFSLCHMCAVSLPSTINMPKTTMCGGTPARWCRGRPALCAHWSLSGCHSLLS